MPGSAPPPSRCIGPRTTRLCQTPAMPETTRAPTDVFEKARTHDRIEILEAAREADVVPYFRLIESEAGPVVEMEGAEKIMLGSNNYLGLTSDPRVQAAAREALERYGTGADGVALSQRHDSPAYRARARDRRVDGDRGLDRLHDRLPGEPGDDRDDPRARRHGRLRLRRPRLDPRRLPALGRQAAPLPPQPHGQARADARARGARTAAECSSSSTASSRWRATSATCRRSSSCASATAPASWSTRRTPRARSASAAPGPASCSGSRTASTCGWGPSRRASPRAEGSSPAPRT